MLWWERTSNTNYYVAAPLLTLDTVSGPSYMFNIDQIFVSTV